MSTKPTLALARWADQIGANLVAPTSGERDLGFGSGTPAASGKVNWEINQLYLWALYLSDGVFSGDIELLNNIKIDGAAEVLGNVTARGTVTVTSGVLNANGGVAVPAGQSVVLSGSATMITGVGTVAHNGPVQFTSDLRMSGGSLMGLVRLQALTASVALSTGNTPNWGPVELTEANPNALQSAVVLRFSGSGSPVVTGLSTGGINGRFVHLVNVGAVSVQFTHEDSNSTATLRFHWPTAATITVAVDQEISIWYDATTARWRLFGKNF